MKNPTESDKKKGGFRLTLERLSRASTEWAGGAWAFGVAFAFVVAWAVTGPVFHFSDSWQLVINTVTSIVTFLMVFLIQRAQNRESKAVQLKLNEIVAALKGASNRLIGVENLSEDELRTLHEHYLRLIERAGNDTDIHKSLSVEEPAGGRAEAAPSRP
jgi:low affinity Fe/Cu permease